MATYFIAETLKYYYLVVEEDTEVNIKDYVFSTEAHNFKKDNFKQEELVIRLGLNI